MSKKWSNHCRLLLGSSEFSHFVERVRVWVSIRNARSGGRQPVSPVQTLLVIIIGAVLSFRLVIPNDVSFDPSIPGLLLQFMS